MPSIRFSAACRNMYSFAIWLITVRVFASESFCVRDCIRAEVINVAFLPWRGTWSQFSFQMSMFGTLCSRALFRESASCSWPGVKRHVRLSAAVFEEWMEPGRVSNVVTDSYTYFRLPWIYIRSFPTVIQIRKCTRIVRILARSFLLFNHLQNRKDMCTRCSGSVSFSSAFASINVSRFCANYTLDAGKKYQLLLRRICWQIAVQLATRGHGQAARNEYAKICNFSSRMRHKKSASKFQLSIPSRRTACNFFRAPCTFTECRPGLRRYSLQNRSCQ